jgi:FkbM family methyltransferase
MKLLKRWIVRAPVGTVRYWVTQTIVVSRCAADPRMRLKMLIVGFVMPLRDKLLGPRDVRLRLRYGRLEIPWTVGPKSDFHVLNEVLVLQVYGRRLPSTEPRTILDLGSHMGATVLFWRERFPEARIVGVEPDPVTFRRLERNVGALPGVELRNVAVSENDGPVTFFPAQQSWVSSLWGDGESVTVEGRSFRSLVAGTGQIDLLKIDVEGAERYIWDRRALKRVRAIVGESGDFGDNDERERFFAGLREDFDLVPEHPAPTVPFSGLRRCEREHLNMETSGEFDRDGGIVAD